MKNRYTKMGHHSRPAAGQGLSPHSNIRDDVAIVRGPGGPDVHVHTRQHYNIEQAFVYFKTRHYQYCGTRTYVASTLFCNCIARTSWQRLNRPGDQHIYVHWQNWPQGDLVDVPDVMHFGQQSCRIDGVRVRPDVAART